MHWEWFQTPNRFRCRGAEGRAGAIREREGCSCCLLSQPATIAGLSFVPQVQRPGSPRWRPAASPPSSPTPTGWRSRPPSARPPASRPPSSASPPPSLRTSPPSSRWCRPTTSSSRSPPSRSATWWSTSRASPCTPTASPSACPPWAAWARWPTRAPGRWAMATWPAPCCRRRRPPCPRPPCPAARPPPTGRRPPRCPPTRRGARTTPTGCRCCGPSAWGSTSSRTPGTPKVRGGRLRPARGRGGRRIPAPPRRSLQVCLHTFLCCIAFVSWWWQKRCLRKRDDELRVCFVVKNSWRSWCSWWQSSCHPVPLPVKHTPVFPSGRLPSGFSCALVTTPTTLFSRCLLPSLVEAQMQVTLRIEAEQPQTFNVEGKTPHYQLHWAQMLQNTLNSHERSWEVDLFWEVVCKWATPLGHVGVLFQSVLP